MRVGWSESLALKPDAELRKALDETLHASLRPVAIGLGVMYIILGATKSLLPRSTPLLAAMEFFIAACMGLLFVLHARRLITPRTAHVAAIGVVALIVVDASVHMLVRAEPLESVSFMLLVLGIGLFFTSWPYFVAATALTVMAWVIAASQFPASPAWGDLAFGMVESLLLSAIVLAVRLRSLVSNELAERRLRYQNSLLEAQGDAAIEGVLVVGKDGRIVSFNKRFIEMWEIPRDVIARRSDEEAIGSVLHRLEDPDAFLAKVRHLYAHPEEHSEDVLRLRDGRVFERYSAPVVGKGGEHYGRVWSFHDVSRREGAEVKIRDLNKELQRRVSQLNDAYRELDSFSGAVSHDIRAPLRAIKHFSDELAEEHAERLDEHGQDLIDRVRKNVAHASALVDDLLKLSRVAKAELVRAPVDLSALVREVVAVLRARDPDRVVELDIEDGVVASGDPGLLRIVVENLLSNAWKYTSPKPRAHIRFSAREEEGRRWFCVTDDGIGFDESQASRLLQPFARLPSAKDFEGTGLGLATVDRIIGRHGGAVRAHGKPDEGAEFCFTL